MSQPKTPDRVLSPKALALLFAVLAPAVLAQPAPTPSPLPDLDLVVAGEVLAVARQPDGGVVFGGNFSQVGGVPRASIARLLPDGSLDSDWNPGANGPVQALVADAAGAVYAGGAFSVIGACHARASPA